MPDSAEGRPRDRRRFRRHQIIEWVAGEARARGHQVDEHALIELMRAAMSELLRRHPQLSS